MGSNLTVRFSHWLGADVSDPEQLMNYFTLSIDDEVVTPTGDWLAKIPKKLVYFYVLIKEIIKANIVVAKIVLSPKMDIKPGIIAVPIRTKKVQNNENRICFGTGLLSV